MLLTGKVTIYTSEGTAASAMQEVWHEGVIERLMWHEAQPSVIFASRPRQSAVVHEHKPVFNWFILWYLEFKFYNGKVSSW